MFHQVNILSIYSNHPWSKNITISTACLSTHWTAHIKNVLLPTSCFLVPFYWKRGFQSSCPCGMICMSQVIQNQVSPKRSICMEFLHAYIPIDMVRMSQTFQNEWVQRSINMELLHAFFTNMTHMARLEKAVGVSEAVGLRLVPRRCLNALGGA